MSRQTHEVCRNKTRCLLRKSDDQGEHGSRKIDLEEKRVYVHTPMIQEPYFSLPVIVAPIEKETAVPTPVVSPPDVAVQETVVPPPVVGPPNVAANGNEDAVPQDHIEPVAMDEGEQQQPPVQEIPVVVAPRRSQRTRKPAISKDYEVYHSEEIQNEGDPPLLKKP